MDGLLLLHEPVSCLTHGLGAVAAVPGTVWLARRVGREDRSRARVATIYGATLIFCMLASAVFHGAVVEEQTRDHLCRLDHCGIFLLIAGTYTPILTHVVTGAPWRRGLLAVWLAAGTGGSVIVVNGLLPPWLATLIYLVLGWGAVALYRHLRRTRSAGEVSLLMEGGLYYSVGALVNLARWPDPWPGVVGSHEVFHVLVLAGALSHFLFQLRVLGPPRVAAAERNQRRERGHGVPPRPLEKRVARSPRAAVARPRSRRGQGG